MCSRTQQHFEPGETLFPGVEVPATWSASGGSIAPTDGMICIIDGKAEVGEFGLIPPFAVERPKYSTFNAKSETMHQLPSFSTSFRKHRCLIPLTRYSDFDDDYQLLFGMEDGSSLIVAGLYYRHPKFGLTCSIVTTTPNKLIEEYHDRMPVILDATGIKLWLDLNNDHQALQALFTPRDVPGFVLKEKIPKKRRSKPTSRPLFD